MRRQRRHERDADHHRMEADDGKSTNRDFRGGAMVVAKFEQRHRRDERRVVAEADAYRGFAVCVGIAVAPSLHLKTDKARRQRHAQPIEIGGPLGGFESHLLHIPTANAMAVVRLCSWSNKWVGLVVCKRAAKYE